MRNIFAIILLLAPCICFGQKSPSGLLGNASLELGGSTAFTNNLPGTINISLINELNKGNLIGLRYYASVFKDKEYSEANLFHTVDNYHLAIGKNFYLNEKVAFTFSTGPAYAQYIKPENIKKAGFGFFGGYDYEEKVYNLLGWSTRLDAKIYTHKYMGFSLGGVFNYNSKISTGGMNLNFIIYLKTKRVPTSRNIYKKG